MTTKNHWSAKIAAHLEGAGLNVFGVAPGGAFDEILPGCRSALVFASGGDALWRAFLEDLRLHPQHLTDEENPLDAFVRRSILASDPDPPPTRRWVRCAADAELFVDFRPLALSAGLGHHSKLGLLLHPEYGPWMGLRAACFTTEELTPTGPLPSASPCEECPAPCVSACHGGAMSLSGLDIRRCASFHIESGEAGPCASRCDARGACPVGAARAYPELELRYHYNRKQGREALAEALGVRSGGKGAGPFWEKWQS